MTNISKLGVEMIVVIAGVLIALFVDKIQENKRDQDVLESTLSSLSNEFKRNASNIRLNLPHQSQFLDTLRHYRSSESYSMFDLLSKTNGYGNVDIYTTNWQTTLSNNNLRFLNFQMVNILSRIDAQHQVFNQQESFVSHTFFGPPLFQSGKDGLSYRVSVEMWLSDHIHNERQLLQLYRDFEKNVADKQYQQR